MRCTQDEIEAWSQEGNPCAQISFSKHSRVVIAAVSLPISCPLYRQGPEHG